MSNGKATPGYDLQSGLSVPRLTGRYSNQNVPQMVGKRNIPDAHIDSCIGEVHRMIATRQSRFSTIPDLIRTVASETMPPSRDTVHLAFEDLLILSLLCLWWALVIVFCLEALR